MLIQCREVTHRHRWVRILLRHVQRRRRTWVHNWCESLMSGSRLGSLKKKIKIKCHDILPRPSAKRKLIVIVNVMNFFLFNSCSICCKSTVFRSNSIHRSRIDDALVTLNKMTESLTEDTGSLINCRGVGRRCYRRPGGGCSRIIERQAILIR